MHVLITTTNLALPLEECMYELDCDACDAVAVWSQKIDSDGRVICFGDALVQRFPNFLDRGPLLLLNIFCRPPGSLATTKDN